VTACTGSAFSGYRFPDAVIALAVRSYLRYRLRYKGRVRPMRRFKTTGTASTFCRGHALIRDLARGFSRLAAGTPPRLRLTTAGETLATML
jgi:transposase-like protein